MLCHTYPGPGGMGGLRVKCAECGTKTNSAAPVCAVCGAPAAGRPSLVAGGPGASPAGAPSGSARFSTTRLRPGYDMEQVDAFLDAVRDTFLGVRQPPLTAEEIRAEQFATTRLRPGYDEQEVDAFLEDVEARLRARCAECGAETGGAVQVCAVCGAPAVARPPAAVDPAPESYLTNMSPELDEHGIPQEARPPRKWLGYLLTGICLASGIGQMYWSVSIAYGVHHRWKHYNYVPLSPSFVAFFVSAGVGVWLARKWDTYSYTERRVLYTALILAMALAIIGWLSLSLIEPYRCCAGG